MCSINSDLYKGSIQRLSFRLLLFAIMLLFFAKIAFFQNNSKYLQKNLCFPTGTNEEKWNKTYIVQK